MSELEEFIIPITTSTGKTMRVVPYETALRLERERNEARATAEDTTPPYEQLYMGHLRVLAKHYLDSEDFHKQIEVLKEERDCFKAALASISLFVSAGIGDEDTTAEEYAKRIKDGIEQMALAMSASNL